MNKIFFLLILFGYSIATAQVLPRKADISVKGFVVDEDSKKKMSATVTVIGHPSRDTLYHKTVEADSGFVIHIPKTHPDETFVCWVTRISYNSWQAGIAWFSQKEINLVHLKRFTGGAKTVRLSSIHFDHDRSIINPKSQKQLDSAVTYLKKYPDVKIEIEGHTDNTGSDDYNLPLSQQRADEVKDYLVSQGVLASRILKSLGMGALQPVGSNDTEEGRAENRRVEIKLVK